MEAKNLRVGNIVTTVKGTKHYGHPLRVEFTTDNNYDLDGPLNSINGYYEKEVIGIELTKKWLLDFGFEVKGAEPDFWEKENFSGSFFSGEFQLTWYELAPCKYVHQLQNLFFAITGEELELIDEPSTCG